MTTYVVTITRSNQSQTNIRLISIHHTPPPPFDVTLLYSGMPRTSNLLKISSDVESHFRNGFFSTLHTDLKVESNFMTLVTKLHNNALVAATGSSDA